MKFRILLLNLWLLIHKFLYNNIFNKKKSDPRKKNFSVFKPDNLSLEIIDSINEHFTKIDIDNIKKEKIKNLPKNLKYRFDLYETLDIDLKSKIYKFALMHSKIRSFNLNHFGFHPRIHKIEILYNIPNKDLKEEGSKSWHRDLDCDFKNIKLFLPLRAINKENGPFYYLKDKRYQTRFLALKQNNENEDVWLRGRVENKIIEKNSKKIDSFLNMKFGSLLLIDTVNTYHKGGFCKSKDRLLLHVSYQGNSWSSTIAQDFTNENRYLMNSSPSLKEVRILKNEILNYKNYKFSSNLCKYFKQFIYKISNLVIINV